MVASHDNLKDIPTNCDHCAVNLYAIAFVRGFCMWLELVVKCFAPIQIFFSSKRKIVGKVLEIITICSPAVLFKGLIVMFATSFERKADSLPRHCFWEKTQGSSKATKLYRHKNTAAVSAWIEHLDKIKTCQTFCQERSKRDTGFKFNYSFYCTASADSALSTFMTLSGRSERAIYWKLILCLHEFWWRIANVTSLKILRIPSLKSLRKA